MRLRRPDVIPNGVRVVAHFGQIATCRLPRAAIRRVWADEAVVSLKARRFLTPDGEHPWRQRSGSGDRRSLGAGEQGGNGFSLSLRSSAPVRRQHTGRDVVVGIVDWGCDFAHPNFRQADGRTRLLGLWDQTKNRPGLARNAPLATNKYGYGLIYTAEAINHALQSSDPYAALGYHPADGDPGGTGAHGTHVMDIAAGNGRAGGRPGVAPEAALLFVHLSTRGVGGRANLGDSVAVLEAIDFIAQAAGGRPWVINLSLGSHGGSHDGTSLVEQGLDAVLLEGPGRAIVGSTGNYYDERIHTSGQLRPGEQRTMVVEVDPADLTANELELWYSGLDRMTVAIHSPGRVFSWWVPLGERAELAVNGQEVGAVYHRAHDPNNGDHHVDLFLYPGGPAGAWEVTLVGDDVVDGRYHGWIERDAGCPHCQTQFRAEDTVLSTNTGAICNGFRTIAVGAYNASSPGQEVAPFSSGGPTRDGRQKPDLLAPGVAILAARSASRTAREYSTLEEFSSLLAEKSGTSMAAPHVTGTIACMFEAAGRPLWIYETRRLLLSSTRPAAGPAAEAHRVGSGYLDIERAIAAAAQAGNDAIGASSFKKSDVPVEHENYPMQSKTNHPNGNAARRARQSYDVVAAPGSLFAGDVRPGDLLVRRAPGEGGRSQVAVVADSVLRPYETLRPAGLTPESHRPGWYVQVVEQDSRRPGRAGGFARLIADENGRLPRDQMVLRPKGGLARVGNGYAAGTAPLVEALPDLAIASTRIDEEIEAAIKAYPSLATDLKEVTLRGLLTADEFGVQITGDKNSYLYPIQIRTAQAGFYALKWDGTGKALYLIDLSTGKEPKTLPDPPLLAGGKEWQQLRRNRVGVLWITVTITAPPPARPPRPEELEFPLHLGYEVLEENFRLMLGKNPPHPLAIPGVTGGIFFPDHLGESGKAGFYGRPLNFTYYTHDGIYAAASRSLVGREFYYIVPIDDIQSYLRTYAVEYAGLAATGSAIISQMLVDMGLNFVPILGPLYGLFQCARDVYETYQNWEKMSGWEIAIVGLEVLLTAVPIVYGGAKIVRGTLAYSKGVDSLVKAGLPKAEARRLMLAAAIFQKEKAARSIVDNLGDMLRWGEPLGFPEVQQVEKILEMMLEQLPSAERLVIAASLAKRSPEAMREFFDEAALLRQQLDGLTQLNPHALVALKGAARSHPGFVERIAHWAGSSPDVVQGINRLEAALKEAHLPQVLDQVGEDLLAELGRSSVAIGPDLAGYVQSAGNASEAYSRLMRGALRRLSDGTKPKGLVALFSPTRSGSLSPALSAIEGEFSQVFLSVNQLTGLSRIGKTVRQDLLAARVTDGQLRSIGTMAAASNDVATAINNLAPALPTHFLPEILDEVGGGLLQIAGRNSYTLSANLAKAVGKQSRAAKAIYTLLHGTTRAPLVPGLLDDLADTLKTTANIKPLLADIELAGHQAKLFARWAIARQSAIKGIPTVLAHRAADARQKIGDLFHAFDYDRALEIFELLEQIERQSGAGVSGLDRIIAELAAGADKMKGATLTLTYAIHRHGGRITGFEVGQTRALAKSTHTRQYDLVADGLSYEFKYWTGFGGEPAARAADEFAHDVIMHVDSNFANLRWVIYKAAESHRPAIESMMRGVLVRREVQDALAELGIPAAEALRRLEAASWLLEFYD
ncbi:MAG: S8 family peptidase [Chloroflexi bacterium]|nr:S8 family peptidase [Chloroflexota bacterium]MCI0579174.1 S8 family peptidase [Chloroflexota bacterium]MCI0647955.1 S8 family peptidase [Chloroflexota bacterium]MCI0726465.1 S8 family peptidase [Chloroflexota bacterium]